MSTGLSLSIKSTVFFKLEIWYATQKFLESWQSSFCLLKPAVQRSPRGVLHLKFLKGPAYENGIMYKNEKLSNWIKFLPILPKKLWQMSKLQNQQRPEYLSLWMFSILNWQRSTTVWPISTVINWTKMSPQRDAHIVDRIRSDFRNSKLKKKINI